MPPSECKVRGIVFYLTASKGVVSRYQYPFESNYVTIDGVRIHYIDEGDGDPVLMIHGQPTWSYLYRNIIPPIAETHRAIALDLMGFGLSDKPSHKEYSFASHTRIVRGFIEELGLKRLTLVLHDWGGPIGLDYAVNHQENMKGLVLMNSSVNTNFKVPLAFRIVFRSPVLSDFLVRRLHVFALALKFGVRNKANRNREVYRNYRERHPDYGSRKGVAMFPRMIPVTARDPAYVPMKANGEALLDFNVPTMFLVGDKDPVSARLDHRPTVQRMPNARLEIIKNAGHFLQEDQPEEVAAKIVKFLAEQVDNSPNS